MLAEDIDIFNKKNIFIMSPIKNNLINQGLFHKLLYSNDLFITNGIYIKLDLCNTKYTNGKLSYDISNNNNKLNKMYEIEKYLLERISNNKKKHYKIHDQFKYGYIRCNNPMNFTILKISGVWENDNAIGISYKIITINEIIQLFN